MHKAIENALTKKILYWLGRGPDHPLTTPNDLTETRRSDVAETQITKRTDQLHSGGYNEAFIFQYWTSYSPRN